MSKEYTVYSKKLAAKLRNQGFRLIRTGVNEKFPQYDTYIFENSVDLQLAISYLTRNSDRNKT